MSTGVISFNVGGRVTAINASRLSYIGAHRKASSTLEESEAYFSFGKGNDLTVKIDNLTQDEDAWKYIFIAKEGQKFYVYPHGVGFEFDRYLNEALQFCLADAALSDDWKEWNT